MTAAGQIVILNGAPRSGKSALAQAIQDSLPGTWVNLGVDASRRSIPERLQPGIGLRPGGERPDLEEVVTVLYAALYESVAAHTRLGINVVVDVGHHESYSKPRHILRDSARRLTGLPVLFVGIRCPIEVIWHRHEESWAQTRENADGEILAAVQRWQDQVHTHGAYDLDVDTSTLSPRQCAQLVTTRLAEGPGSAFERLRGDEAS
jgi:chloramphenicol 3-O phosphotransferase